MKLAALMATDLEIAVEGFDFPAFALGNQRRLMAGSPKALKTRAGEAG